MAGICRCRISAPLRGTRRGPAAARGVHPLWRTAHSSRMARPAAHANRQRNRVLPGGPPFQRMPPRGENTPPAAEPFDAGQRSATIRHPCHPSIRPTAPASAPFTPRFMKVGVYSKALEELTPRAVREADPDRRSRTGPGLPATSGRPRCSWPRPCTQPARCSGGGDARPGRQHPGPPRSVHPGPRPRVLAALRRTGVELSDLGYFDNLLHQDPVEREQEARSSGPGLRCRGAAWR